MSYKILFIRNSPSSFRVYVKHKHKMCYFIASGQFKRRLDASSNVFVRFNSMKFSYFLSNTKDLPGLVSGFITFINDARNIKVL